MGKLGSSGVCPECVGIKKKNEYGVHRPVGGCDCYLSRFRYCVSLVWLAGFSHFVVLVFGGPLARFELLSSSSSPSLRSSLLPMMLSPFPSSESVKFDRFAAFPSGSCPAFGISLASGRTFGSSSVDSVGPLGVLSAVPCDAGGSNDCSLLGVLLLNGRTSGSSSGVFVWPLGVVSLVSCGAGGPLVGSGSCFLLFGAESLGSADRGVLRRSAFAAFYAASASLIFARSLSWPLLCLCWAASSLASAAYFCRSGLRGSGTCLAMGGIFSLPLEGGAGCFVVVPGG